MLEDFQRLRGRFAPDDNVAGISLRLLWVGHNAVIPSSGFALVLSAPKIILLSHEDCRSRRLWRLERRDFAVGGYLAHATRPLRV